MCVEVLHPSQPNGVMSSEVSLPNDTFTEQAQSSLGFNDMSTLWVIVSSPRKMEK